MMRLFITGATGFIGSHVVQQALQDRHHVLGLRRSDSSQTRIRLAEEPEWLTAPLENVAAETLSNCDALIHLAAHSVAFPHDTLEACLRANVDAPLALFRRARAAGIDRFIVAGSCFEYGLSGQSREFIPPDAPLLPTNSYAASKAAASVTLHALAVEAGLRLSIHRIFHVFGEGEAESRFWPSLRRAALSGDDFAMTAGEQVRDFTPVEFVARELLRACDNDTIQGGVPQIVNLGTGTPLSLKGFAGHWWNKWQATGKLRFGEVPYRDGEVMRYVPMIDAAAKPITE